MNFRLRTAFVVFIALALQVDAVPGGRQRGAAVDHLIDAKLAFDVASVKLNELGSQSMLWEFRSGRFTARYATSKSLIVLAYGKPELALTPSQVIGAPKWLDVDRFDVLATAPDVPDSPRGIIPAPILEMLRNLLEERFQLKAHFETREYLLFALVLSKKDGTLGPGLRRRLIPCTARAVRDRTELFAPTDPVRQTCGGRTDWGMLLATGATMTNLVTALSQPQLIPGVGRIVVDRTGLSGTFDIDLRWSPDTPLPGALRDASPAPSADSNAPPLLRALEEQLGLKLEPTKGPVEVLVIDHIERPTEN